MPNTAFALIQKLHVLCFKSWKAKSMKSAPGLSLVAKTPHLLKLFLIS